MHTSLSLERRTYTCDVCGTVRVIEVKVLDKAVVVCAHPDTRGGILPMVKLREEGVLVRD